MDKDEASLGEFLSSWKAEIRTSQLVGKKRECSDIGKEDQMPSPSSKRSHTATSNTGATPATPPLLVLPAGQVMHTQQNPKTNHTEEKVKGHSFLDILISDLDEINSIPFFDVQLPREIAMVIFQHLNAKDLCRCAMVSKSWSSLATDNLLWYRIYQKMQSRPVAPPGWCCCYWRLVEVSRTGSGAARETGPQELEGEDMWPQ